VDGGVGVQAEAMGGGEAVRGPVRQVERQRHLVTVDAPEGFGHEEVEVRSQLRRT
jgi:hypothetical protein